MTKAVLYLALFLVSSVSNGDRGAYSQESHVEQRSICLDYGSTSKTVDLEDIDDGSWVNQMRESISIYATALSTDLSHLNVDKQDTQKPIRAPPNNIFFNN